MGSEWDGVEGDGDVGKPSKKDFYYKNDGEKIDEFTPPNPIRPVGNPGKKLLEIVDDVRDWNGENTDNQAMEAADELLNAESEAERLRWAAELAFWSSVAVSTPQSAQEARVEAAMIPVGMGPGALLPRFGSALWRNSRRLHADEAGTVPRLTPRATAREMINESVENLQRMREGGASVSQMADAFEDMA
ncbi:hypothetical protein EA187_17430 [Lujinxingia sediminis]|uniref:Uncharacterized protein n=1 Tax=Lujinxingia sediminis TaxID=2480984 RepID=A0ABY0CP72_9DELT|nr:hypothetical protein [Lujinxingia sediminis]RVU42120.1 hypothetical protein EA187_17430 [Lujinxingia sediminis]